MMNIVNPNCTQTILLYVLVKMIFIVISPNLCLWEKNTFDINLLQLPLYLLNDWKQSRFKFL